MVKRLGEMRKGRRERIDKGSREGIEKETRQFEEKEDLRERPPFIRILDPTLRCSHRFFKSSRYDKLELKHQNLFLQAIESIIKKMSWCETECKKMCHW